MVVVALSDDVRYRFYKLDVYATLAITLGERPAIWAQEVDVHAAILTEEALVGALTRAIEAARTDPYGGKVLLTVDFAEAILGQINGTSHQLNTNVKSGRSKQISL